MIIEYHRPKTIKEALTLINRKEIPTYPLGGGVSVSHKTGENYAVVDLQDLGLNQIIKNGERISIGATVSLQGIVDNKGLPETIREAARRELSFNLRQVSTVAGTLVKSTGKSPLALALMAADALLVVEPGTKNITLSEYYSLRGDWKGIITNVVIAGDTLMGMEIVSKTPEDQMIVGAAIGRWVSGRTRIVLGGDFISPPVVLDENFDKNKIEVGIKNAYSQYINNNQPETEYSKKTSSLLIERLMKSFLR